MVKKTKQKHQLRHAVVGTLGALGFMTLTTQAASASQVTVKPGDTVWGIAQQHGLTTKAIEDANPTTVKKISNTVDLIQAGQKLTLPDGHDNGETAGSITATNNIPQAGNTVKWGNAGTGQIAGNVNGVQSVVANQQTISPAPTGQVGVPVMGQTANLTSVRSQANTNSEVNTTQAQISSSAAQYQVSTRESTAAATAGQAQSVNGNQQVASNASAAVQTISQPLAVSAQPVNSSTSGEGPATTTAPTGGVSQQPVQSQPMQEQTSVVSTNVGQEVVSNQPVQSQSVQGQTPAVQISTSQQPVASGQPIQAQPVQGQTSVAPSQSQTVASSTPASTAQATSPASQSQQSGQSQQPSQSTVAAPQVPQTSASDNLQSGSVVSLATKIASSNSVPYVWGGNSLSGMDCSGLVDYVYAHAENKQLPHNSTMLESYVNQHAVSEAQPGDILFWGNHGSSYHVAIYTGNNQYVAAAQPGTNVSLYTLSPYFAPSFAGTVK